MTSILASGSCRVYCGQRSYSVTDTPEKNPAGPPPVIGSDRVLHYAIGNDRVGYSPGHGLLSVNHKELGKVPCLAICRAPRSSAFLLYHCALDWSTLGVAPYDSVAAAKRRKDASR
jgi:hypothetical protein